MNPGTADSELNETPIPPPRSLLRLALPSAGITLLMLAATYWVRMRIPAGTRVPMHWNAAGQVDGYGDRNTLFLLPGITVLLAVILALVPRFDPRGRNILMSGKAYGMVWFSVTLFLGVIQGAMLLTAMGHPVSIMRVIIPATGLLFLVLGNYLGKVRSNFFFGVRTPADLMFAEQWHARVRTSGGAFRFEPTLSRATDAWAGRCRHIATPDTSSGA